MPTQVHNPTLKAKLRSLAMRALPFLDELVSTGRIPSGYRAGAEVIIGGYMTGPLPHVRAMREFQACKEQMNATPAIHNLFKAIVGTTSDVQATAGGADICLTMFIRRLFSAGSAFDPAIFDTHYEAFEELFYSTRFRYRQRVRLFWFDCEVDVIELSSGVVVKRLPPSSREAENLWVYQARGLKPYSMSDFILEWTGDVNKLS